MSQIQKRSSFTAQSPMLAARFLALMSVLSFSGQARAGEIYVGVFGGLDLHTANSWSTFISNGNVRRKDGLAIGGRFGDVIADTGAGQVRAEAELAYRRNNVATVDSKIFSTTATTGHVSALSAMGNVYLDFGSTDTSIRPFVGAGIGISRLHHRTQDNSATLVAVDYVKNVDAGASLLVWQVMGGASARLGNKARLTLEGRYQQTAAGTLKASGAPVYKTERRGVSLLVGVNFGL